MRASHAAPADASHAAPAIAAGATTTCALPAYPNPSCTGRPASLGSTYANTYTGDYVASTPGQVIDNWHVVGHILIEADNVTIKNSLVEGSITNEIGDGFLGSVTISDTSIIAGPDKIFAGYPGEECDTEPAIGQTHYSAERVFIDFHATGFQTSHDGHVSIRDSFARICGLSPQYTVGHSVDGTHADPYQAYCPEAPDVTCDNIILDHNTFDDVQRPIISNDESGKPYVDHNQYVTAPIWGNLGPGNGYGRSITITNNLIMGGAFSMYTGWRAGANLVIQNNRIVDGTWAYGPVDTEGSCSHINWSGNAVVDIDGNYQVTKTVAAQPCVN